MIENIRTNLSYLTALPITIPAVTELSRPFLKPTGLRKLSICQWLTRPYHRNLNEMASITLYDRCIRKHHRKSIPPSFALPSFVAPITIVIGTIQDETKLLIYKLNDKFFQLTFIESCDISTGVTRLSADNLCKRSRACCSTAITNASWTAFVSSPAVKKRKNQLENLIQFINLIMNSSIDKMKESCLSWDTEPNKTNNSNRTIFKLWRLP